MAVSVAEVSTPSATSTWSTDGQYKTHTVNVTFDNSYVTGGEPITAAQLGFTQLVDVVGSPVAANAAGTLTMPVLCKANSTGSQMTLQLQRYDGASAGKASLEEAANAFDASLFTARITFKGF